MQEDYEEMEITREDAAGRITNSFTRLFWVVHPLGACLTNYGIPEDP